jgi:hypothetical protein
MSREVLLTLLGTLLVVNVGVLVTIGLLSRRGRARRMLSEVSAPAARVQVSAPAPETSRRSEAVSLVEEARTPVGSDADAGRVERTTPVASAASTVVSPASTVVSPASTVASAASTPAEGFPGRPQSVAVAVADHERKGCPIGGNGHVVDALNEPVETGTTSTPVVEPAARSMDRNRVTTTAGGGKRRRSRRFVLPPLEEDGDRSARAIEAFLGEALPSPPLAHPERLQRRRHRARRAPGSKAIRTSLVVDLVGYQQLAVAAGERQASRLAGALTETLWRSARVGDEVRELAPGRILLVLDCDATGADAFAERARASVGPWLAASSVPLRIEIARQAEDSASGP